MMDALRTDDTVPVAEPVMASAPESGPDLAKVKRNIQRMIDQGAQESEIDQYVAAEGTTPEELRADRSTWSKVTGAVGDIADSVTNSVMGKQDPAFEGVPAFTGDGIRDLDTRKKIEQAKAVTFEDAAYGDIVKKALGPRLLNSETDANGYEILTYRGDDGQEHKAYLNQPGLDAQDVDRGIAAAAPFVAMGGLSGAVAKGLGGRLLTRMAAQGLGAGGASIAADQVAGQMGSEQGTDFVRAGVATVGGAALEGLSGPIARTWAAIFRRGGMKDGKLTGEAARQARKMGLDPDDMEERLARSFARDLEIAADPAEARAKAQAGEFNIPTTVGQRTKNPKALGVEEEARRGLFGDRAQSIMQDFEKRQSQAIEGAVNEGIGGRLAPNAAGREPATLGQRVRDSARSARAIAEQTEDQLWEALGPMYPVEGVVEETLPKALTNRITQSGIRPDRELTPAAHKMAMMLDDYMAGKQMTSPYTSLGEDAAELSIDDMRRRLLGVYQSADKGGDKRAAKALYDGFNDWIDDIAEAAAIRGDTGGAAKLVTARAFTRDLKSLFEPKGRGGRTSPAARKIASVLDEADTPEGAINALIGRGGPTGSAPEGTVQALQHMKRILGDTHKDAWNDIRLAYWTRIAVDKQGKMLSPGRMRNNIQAAFQNQPSVMNTLFTKQEQNLMRRFAKALDDATYTPPNPSGTSYELQRMRNRGKDSALKTFAQTQQKRELFSKHNVIGARIWQMIAKKLPLDPMGAKEQAGAKVAEKVIGQEVRRRAPPSQAYIGATGGADYVAD